MKITVQTKGVIITAKQKSLIEKKIGKLKKYIPDETAKVEVVLSDETGSEKGGVDQNVSIFASFGKEKIIIQEVDDRLMRGFAFALKRFERQLSRYHHRGVVVKRQTGGGRLEKVWKIVRRKK